MIESLKKAHAHGLVVKELCTSDAFRDEQWVHRDGVMFGCPSIEADVMALWPSVRVVKPIGIVTDVPEVVN